MSSPASGWRPPLCDSRTGAAHRRRGAPCQDASGVWSFLDAGRQAVQLLVVSDGHGGSRYDRSDVGSRLACRVALQTAHALFCSQDAVDAGQEQWSQWLAQELPRQITTRWRQQVLTHAEAHPRSDGATVSITPYGATLGLLLLTPRWWGYTGLGDWDLVRLDADGQGELVSEEPDTPGGGEATYSLCMEGAERFFASRSGVHAIPADSPAFSLLLSSDGIRKSCGTDTDFLTLSHYLCGLPPARKGQKTSELAGALDHISSQGSGDDVSVAIGRWGPLPASERGHSRRRGSKPVFSQPELDPGAAKAASGQEPSGGGAVAEGDGSSGFATASVPPWRRAKPWLLGLTGGLVLAAAGVGVAALLGWGPFARRDPEPGQFSPEQLAVVKDQAKLLCSKSSQSVAPQSTRNPAGNESSENTEGQPQGKTSQQKNPTSELLTHESPPSEGGGEESFPENTGSFLRSEEPVGSRHGRQRDQPAIGQDYNKKPPFHQVPTVEESNGASQSPMTPVERQASTIPVRDDIQIIRSKVTPYKKIFEELAGSSKDVNQVLKDVQARKFPQLAALIAWSFQNRELLAPDSGKSTPVLSRLLGWLQPPQPSVVGLCPELKQVLREQWMATDGE